MCWQRYVLSLLSSPIVFGCFQGCMHLHPQIDATLDDNKALAEKYQIRGFPTLKVRASSSALQGLHACEAICVGKQGLHLHHKLVLLSRCRSSATATQRGPQTTTGPARRLALCLTSPS